MKSFITSMAMMVALAAILTSTCRADDVINAVPVPEGEKLYVGADSMSTLHKMFPDGGKKNTGADSMSTLQKMAAGLIQNIAGDRTSRQTPSLLPELISRLPVSGLFDFGAKALNIARFWPAGLASLVVGTAPTTGAVVGVVAISIFIIVIWLVIYSIGVLPVGAALLGRQDFMDYPAPGMMPYPGQGFGGPHPYNHRFQRSLADASRTVMDAIDQFKVKNN